MVGAVHGRGVFGRGHAWQGACMVGGACVAGVCVAGGMLGGGGGVLHAWQERQPLRWTVRILLDCILVLALLSFKVM